MYYLDIILAICFLIGYCFFALYMTYAAVQYYLTKNPENLKIVNKNEQKYKKKHIAD